MSRRNTTLYRDTENQKFGGVCSGLARYFDLDPLLVRVVFVAALFFGGGSLLAYLLLWWLVDPAPEAYWADGTTPGESSGTFPPPTGSGDPTSETQAA